MTQLRPMLATRGDALPSGDQWVHELKWDGMRVLVEIRPDESSWWSRTGRLVRSFPELASGAHELASTLGPVILDGEVVALVDGVPDFGRLSERMNVRDVAKAHELASQLPVQFVGFDVLAVGTSEVYAMPWSQRRELLEAMQLERVGWVTSPVFDDGPSLQAAVREQGLEGTVAKLRQSSYRLGERSASWLKFPLRERGEFAVVGARWQAEGGGLAALLLAQREGSHWTYRGRVGTGWTASQSRDIADWCRQHRTDSAVLAEEVRTDLDDALTTWVWPPRPATIEYLQRSAAGRLRHPVFLGWRPSWDLSESEDPDEASELGDVPGESR